LFFLLYHFFYFNRKLNLFILISTFWLVLYQLNVQILQKVEQINEILLSSIMVSPVNYNRLAKTAYMHSQWLLFGI